MKYTAIITSVSYYIGVVRAEEGNQKGEWKTYDDIDFPADKYRI